MSGGREDPVRSLTRELTEAANQTRGRRAVTEAGSCFLLPGGEGLQLCGVGVKDQTQVDLGLGVTAGPCLFWSERRIAEPRITSILSLEMARKIKA